MPLVNCSEIKLNPKNPRTIKDKKFKELVKSLKSFPEMLSVRPVVVNTDMVVLGGNMRFQAIKEAGWEKCEVAIVDWPQEKQDEFIFKDNINYGEWDWAMLPEWNLEDLKSWGVDLKKEAVDDKYTKKIDSITYAPTGEKPNTSELVDLSKVKELLKDIDKSLLPEEIKDFLRVSAYRHAVFNYSKIAEFYCNVEKGIQELIEKSALVIIDIQQAIENGFIELTDEIIEQYEIDYNK